MKRLVPLFLVLTACGSSREPDYYTLRAVDGAPAAARAARIEVRRPGLPASLAKPEMMTSAGYRVKPDDGAVWAEPLDKQIERTLALDLAQRLPGSTVFTETGGITVEPDYVVDSEWLGFGPTGAGGSRLTVQTALSRPRSAEPAVPGTPLVLDTDSGATGIPLAETVSGLVGRIADSVARDIERTPAAAANVVTVPETDLPAR